MSFLQRVKGQPEAVEALRRFLAAGRVPSALLFHGLDGIGKTLAAFEFCKALVCPSQGCGLCEACQAVDAGSHPDVKRVDAVYQATLREEEAAKQATLRTDTIKHLRHDMSLRSMLGSWKAAVVCDAHAMETEAANALLKILEEPPPQTLWILVTPARERVIKTVESRCVAVRFKPLPEALVGELLVAQGIDQAGAAALAELSEGSVSRAAALAEAPVLCAGPRSALAAAEAAEKLPKELYLQRARVEAALERAVQELRRKALSGRAAALRPALTELATLRRSLRSNVDPRLILTLAGAAVEAA